MEKTLNAQSSTLKVSYYYDGSLPLAEKDATGKVKKVYVNDGEGIIGMVRAIYDDSGVFSHYQRLYYLYDSLGSVSYITGENGMSLQNYTYSPYGTCLNVTDDPINNFQFVGRYGGYKDNDSGLTYFWHRWYDASDGRWVSRDPIGIMGGINLMTYTFNRPNYFLDDAGLCPDTGCTEQKDCDKGRNNRSLKECLDVAKNNYWKAVLVYFVATTSAHEAAIIGCALSGPGYIQCLIAVEVILKIPDLIAIGAFTTGYLQNRSYCFDRYGCK